MQKGRCSHLNGIHHNTHCLAGVAYQDVVTDPEQQEGIAWRYPCTDMGKFAKSISPSQAEHFARRGTCEKYQEPSEGEIAEYEAKIEARHKQFMLTLPLIEQIKKDHKGASWQGIETCPVCGGKLHLSHAAYNGHVWGQCETEGCLSWME